MAYYPSGSVAWRTIINDIIVNPSSYTVTVCPVNINEPGASTIPPDIAAGYYLIDFLGHIYEIESVDSTVETTSVITVLDTLSVGTSPTDGRNAYVVKSVASGDGLFLTPVQQTQLDYSATDYLMSVYLDTIWLNRGIKLIGEETDTNLTAVEIGTSLKVEASDKTSWNGGKIKKISVSLDPIKATNSILVKGASGEILVSDYSVIDDDTFSTASSTSVSTSESTKAYVDNKLNSGSFLDNVVAMQVDDTLTPVTTEGNRYIILDSANLNAGFGVINKNIGGDALTLGDNDIVQYVTSEFRIAFDSSAAISPAKVVVGTDSNGNSNHEWSYNINDDVWIDLGETILHNSLPDLNTGGQNHISDNQLASLWTYVNATDIKRASGKVGIGIDPVYNFHGSVSAGDFVAGFNAPTGSSPNIYFGINGIYSGAISYTAGLLSLRTGGITSGEDRLKITNTGRVYTTGAFGIGVEPTPYHFHVQKDDGVSVGEHILGTIGRTSSNNIILGYRTDGVNVNGLFLRTTDSQPMYFGTSGYTQLLTLTNTGRMGILNTNPSYSLDVTGELRATGAAYLGNFSKIIGTTTGSSNQAMLIFAESDGDSQGYVGKANNADSDIWAVANSGYIRVAPFGASRIICTNVGTIISGTTISGSTASSALDVRGALTVSSGGVFGGNITIGGVGTTWTLSMNNTTAIRGVLDEDNMASDSALHVPTQQSVKAYVQATAQTINYLPYTIVAATTGNITIATALNNGDALDGVTLVTNDYVLVKDQSSPAENGVYIVQASPARATFMDTASEFKNSAVFISGGTVNGGSSWIETATVVNVGTDPVTFAKIGQSTTYLPGTGLDLVGSTFSIESTVLTETSTNTVSNKTISGASNTLTVRLANDVTGELPVANGGTGLASITTNSYLKGNGTGDLIERTYAEVRTDLGLVIGTNVQAYSSELTAVAAIATTGFVKRTGVNTWTTDSSTYLTGNQTITLSGDITGSGATSIATTLATVNANVGTYGSATQSPVFTVNAKGLITAVSSVTITPAYNNITTIPAAIDAIDSLVPSANKLAYYTGASTASLADLSAFARTILDDADAAAVKTTLGLTIGVHVQAYDATLAALAGMSSSANEVVVSTGADTFDTIALTNAYISASAAIAWSKMANLTASRALVSDTNGDVSVSSVTSTQLGYLSGVTSAIQTQLNNKQPLANNLTYLAAVTAATDTLPFFDSASSMITVSFTDFSQTLLPLASAAAWRSALGTATVSNGGTGLTTIAGGSILAANTLDTLSAITSITGLKVLQNSTGTTSWATVTGTGNPVYATSPTLVTPILGTPTSGTLTNCTGLPVATGISGLGAGIATFLATPSSANLRSAVTDETGTGALVFANGNIGAATATSVNKVIITAPATSATLTIANGVTVSAGGNLTIATGSAFATSGAYSAQLTFTGTTNATIPSGTKTLLALDAYTTLSTMTTGSTVTWSCANGAVNKTMTVSGSGTLSVTNLSNGMSGDCRLNVTAISSITLSTGIADVKGNGLIIDLDIGYYHFCWTTDGSTWFDWNIATYDT